MSTGAMLCSVPLAVAVALGSAGDARARAGLLTGGAADLEPITLSSGQAGSPCKFRAPPPTRNGRCST